jgi:hypothetical protein
MEIFKDPSRAPEARARDLLSRMTEREKIGQLTQSLYGFRIYERDGERITLSKELACEAERYGGIGGIYGLFRADPWSARDEENGLKFLERYQDRLMFACDFCSPDEVGKLALWLDEMYLAGKLSETVYMKICRENAIRILKLQ